MELPVVNITDGQLKGCFMTDYDGGNIYAFRGIPYAKPAVGDLRFKAPLPIDPWVDVKDASNNGDKCIQRDFYSKANGILEGSENCLHLNVYTKELPSSKSSQLKPVMVWIHGGGFHNGSNRSEMFGPEYLLTQDIVLVTVNYRVGILGFLKLDDPSLEVYGNAGLKDQQLGLKWVQKNIHIFNGDPNNVTIFGESAGSASVHYHILSPTSKGLFHRAILQSGSALNAWASQPKEQPFSMPEFVKVLGKDVQNDQEALHFLRTIPAEELYIAQETFVRERAKTTALLIFTPTVEVPNDTAFITNKPIDLITSGQFNKVPMIFGYTSAEGLFFIIDRKMKISKGIEVLTAPSKLEDYLPRTIREKQNTETFKKLCDKMNDVYKNDQNNIQLISDLIFVPGIISSVKLHSQISENLVYLYRMDLDDDLNLIKKMCPTLSAGIPGMGHADDQGYLFSNENIPPPKRGGSAEVAMRRIVKLWTNFAKYGQPTKNENELNIMWQPATRDTLHFLDIGPVLTLQTDPDRERVLLWEEIFELAQDS